MATETTSAKPKEKSFKDKFLDVVNEKYGIASAALMEDLAKKASKQNDKLALEQGIPVQKIAEMYGMDFSELTGNKADSKTKLLDTLTQQAPPQSASMMPVTPQAPQEPQAPAGQPVGQPQTNPQEVLGQLIDKVPARTIFDTGDTFKSPDGTIQQSDKGSLVKILEFLATGSFGKGGSSNSLSPTEQESYMLNNQLKKMEKFPPKKNS
jgi:hypothetical protein